jgi:hypothetical protein
MTLDLIKNARAKKCPSKKNARSRILIGFEIGQKKIRGVPLALPGRRGNQDSFLIPLGGNNPDRY